MTSAIVVLADLVTHSPIIPYLEDELNGYCMYCDSFFGDVWDVYEVEDHRDDCPWAVGVRTVAEYNAQTRLERTLDELEG